MHPRPLSAGEPQLKPQELADLLAVIVWSNHDWALYDGPTKYTL